MRLGFLKDNESRVSITPVTLKKYIDAQDDNRTTADTTVDLGSRELL